MAVYTLVSEEQVSKFLSIYNIGHFKSIKPIKEGIENSNYLLNTTQGKFILTILEKRTHKQNINLILKLQLFLLKHNICCPKPFKTKDGYLFSTLCNKPAVIVNFLKGKSCYTPDKNKCFQGGKWLANMHNKCKTFDSKPINFLSLDKWKAIFKECLNLKKTPLVEKNKKLIKEELILIESQWNKLQKLPFSICHGDFFPNNVFFKKDNITAVFDFYFACYELCIYDLAIMINAWCFDEKGKYSQTKFKYLLQGYSTERMLSDLEIKYLPLALQCATLRIFLTRLYDKYSNTNTKYATILNPLKYQKLLKFHKNNKNLIIESIKQ